MGGSVRYGGALLATVLAFVALPAVATAAVRTWSGPVLTDAVGGYVGMSAIACPSTDQCTAVDGLGRETTFDPADPAPPAPLVVDAGDSLTAIACPSTSQCTAVDRSGAEVTFDPAAPSGASVTRIDPNGDSLSAVACPTTDQCTAVVG